MSFSEKSCLVFEQATKAYHITDHIDATVHNPYEVKSIEFYLYLKNWIDAVQWHFEDIIRDPYVLEFLGLSPNDDFYESDLEQALITHLQKFLLGLGRGFSFVARQKRITFDGRHFRIDLVFYNYILKCFVLIDLKIGDLTHQDLGQMQMYVHYYERELMNEGDNPPIGIVLCADKSDAVVRYTLPEGETQVFASKYKLYLPTEEELLKELKKEYQAMESVQSDMES